MAHFKCSSYTNYNNLWFKISCTTASKGIILHVHVHVLKTEIFIAFVFSEFRANWKKTLFTCLATFKY